MRDKTRTDRTVPPYQAGPTASPFMYHVTPGFPMTFVVPCTRYMP
jgi:hypothetical protein